MRYLSVCSGIESASVAWHPLGWSAVAFSEIEPFPCAVLAHHYPDVPNWGDMTKFQGWPDATIDVLVGGTPCQSFSVAGLRKGLADPRGNLMLTYLAIAARYRPEWMVWENVPGVLSADGGRAFGTFLGGLAELGYGFAYRILDAQYFGLAQRRKRVFVVANSRDWHRAAAVLFERASLRGDSAPSREAGQRSAPSLAARTKGGGGLGTDFDCDGGLIPDTVGALTDGAHNGGGQNGKDASGVSVLPLLSLCLNAGAMGLIDAESETLIPTTGGGFDVAHSLKADGFDASEDGTGRGTPLIPIAFANTGGATNLGISETGEAPPVTTRHGDPGNVQLGMHVRRLTPRECERLQGFPDDYTLVQVRGKPAADGPRYKALGNSKAAPVVRWIGERIASVHALSRTLVA